MISTGKRKEVFMYSSNLFFPVRMAEPFAFGSAVHASVHTFGLNETLSTTIEKHDWTATLLLI
jgi:hypothetical protein